jgi:transketolase
MKLGWPISPRFFVPDEVLEHFRKCLQRGQEIETYWENLLIEYRKEYPELAGEFERRIAGILPQNWESDLPVFSFDEKGIATRAASGKVINALSKGIPELIGGSADLTPSNKTWIDGFPSFQISNREGRNFHFGVREHGMGAAVNGMAAHGGVIPYGGTFLVFSDYMKASIRLSALSDYPCIWIFTHDSIGLGEDGPTHQPVEHIASLRGIPNLVVIRPADANEVSEAWRVAIQRRDGPSALLLSRQNLPIIDRSKFCSARDLDRGAYILKDFGEKQPEMMLIASGSEVELIIKAAIKLVESGISVRVVSFPSWELFENQDENYQNSVFPTEIKKRIAVEAGISMGWEKWVGDEGRIISVNKFGASAPFEKIYKEYGLTVNNIISTAKEMF